MRRFTKNTQNDMMSLLYILFGIDWPKIGEERPNGLIDSSSKKFTEFSSKSKREHVLCA